MTSPLDDLTVTGTGVFNRGCVPNGSALRSLTLIVAVEVIAVPSSDPRVFARVEFSNL